MISVSKKYYVMYDDGITAGPYNFKEAMKLQDEAFSECQVLKLVIDYEGKEVK